MRHIFEIGGAVTLTHMETGETQTLPLSVLRYEAGTSMLAVQFEGKMPVRLSTAGCTICRRFIYRDLVLPEGWETTGRVMFNGEIVVESPITDAAKELLLGEGHDSENV